MPAAFQVAPGFAALRVGRSAHLESHEADALSTSSTERTAGRVRVARVGARRCHLGAGSAARADGRARRPRRAQRSSCPPSQALPAQPALVRERWSGRQDSNLRPLPPQGSALARLRHAPTRWIPRLGGEGRGFYGARSSGATLDSRRVEVRLEPAHNARPIWPAPSAASMQRQRARADAIARGCSP